MITQNGGVEIEAGNILIIAPDWASIQALNKAHADALAEIHQIGFDAKHQQGWTYASFDAIANVLRPVLSKHGLSIAPTMDNAILDMRGRGEGKSPEVMATAFVSMALIHERGAMRVTKHQAQGSDYSDKAINKAWTVAAKYALMRLFLISTGEKDENEDDDIGKVVPERKPEPLNQQPAQPRLDWTQNPTERAAFQQWRERLTLSDAECKRLAAAYQGQSEPLKFFREYPGTRADLQNAIEAQMAREQAMR